MKWFRLLWLLVSLLAATTVLGYDTTLVRIDSISGILDATHAPAGDTLKFHIGFVNRHPTGSYHLAAGFLVYSRASLDAGDRGSGSATWVSQPPVNQPPHWTFNPNFARSGPQVDTTGYLSKANFGAVFTFNCFDCNGQGIDTIGFAAAANDPGTQTGMAPHDSGTGFTIWVVTALADTNKVICIDSTMRYPPTNTWKWAPYNSPGATNQIPGWSGARCFMLLADFDSDGILDAVDNCPRVANPGQEDTDGDGVGNACDNCPSFANAGQTDADNDGIGDACDPCTDTDRDGLGNPGYAANTCPTDNCPNIANPGQEDTDHDGIGDECDQCTDSDGDGFGDPGFFRNTCPTDNCPYVYNPGQEDSDGDGKGDGCDAGAVAFSATPQCGSAPLDVSFTDLTSPYRTITSWYWLFGDGSSSTSQNPTHRYTDVGVFDVTLIVSDGSFADTLTMPQFVTTQVGITADFVGLPRSGRSPLAVMFEPILEGIANSYQWDFGDGASSTLRNPIHIYQNQGSYSVSLIVRLTKDGCDQGDTVVKQDYIVVQELEADFAASPLAGMQPLLVQFSDSSAGQPTSWYWDFGDGSAPSNVQNPAHLYTQTGTFDVFLRVTNAFGQDSLERLGYINVGPREVDLAGEIYDGGARPGFSILFYVVWTNTGTAPADNTVLKILPPPEVTGIAVAPGHIRSGSYSGYTMVGDTIVIPLGSVDPTGWYGGYVRLTGIVPETIPLGYLLICKSWLTTTSTEVTTLNNDVEHPVEVRGSIDPNDKRCSPEGEGTAGEVASEQRLNYQILFENKPEASAEAIYVRIVDTLDANLDWSTLAFGEMSHPTKCKVDFDPYKGILTCFCDSIMLPPNHNAPEGEGWISYSISPKEELKNGTVIPNRAWIRFDFNAWLGAPETGPVLRTLVGGCCMNLTGNVDCDPADGTDISDLTALIDNLYISLAPLCCTEEANVDGDPAGGIDISDLTALIDYLYISFTPPAPCP
jgi:PKD repeat protein